MAGDVKETLIGAGGWAYFHGPSGRALPDYSRAFRFVEVNVTFYRHPSVLDARRWRASVPADFVFAVKGHRSITHGQGFRATREARAAFSRDAVIARVLRSDTVVLQTPQDREFGREEVKALRDLAATDPMARIALEPRAYAGRALPAALASALRDVGGLDVVDLSKGETPRVESGGLYTRLMGKGVGNVWEFSDDELREIALAAKGQDSGRMTFAFHGVRMYKDAARFLSFERTGTLPPATRQQGLGAVREVLEPDARFPATKADLLRDHGWKAVAMEGRGNVHAADVLSGLPDRRFASLGEVLASLPS